MRAATLEATALTTGGAAIRFQLFKPGTASAQCVVDREMMMNMNLDSSGGLPHNLLGLCGGTHYYWRHANGGADASNLKTGGTCTAGFPNRVSGSVLGVPVGRLPHGHELPNHLGDCTGADGKLCTEVVRYNAISDVEECCEACRELRFLDATPDFATNPCLAFQIVQGKCHVARQKLFTTRWPKYSGTVTITASVTASSFRTLHVHHGTHIARIPSLITRSFVQDTPEALGPSYVRPLALLALSHPIAPLQWRRRSHIARGLRTTPSARPQPTATMDTGRRARVGARVRTRTRATSSPPYTGWATLTRTRRPLRSAASHLTPRLTASP